MNITFGITGWVLAAMLYLGGMPLALWTMAEGERPSLADVFVTICWPLAVCFAVVKAVQEARAQRRGAGDPSRKGPSNAT